MAVLREPGETGGAMPPVVSAEQPATVAVWDPLVRLFHWSLVAAFAIAWATGDELEQVHEAVGYAIVGMLAFRVVWGLIGGRHARFSDFVYRPSTVVGHMVEMARLRAPRYLGHNPAGGAMVIALLLLLAATTATGIMMTTDAWWGIRWVEEAHELTANLTVLLVGLHLAGVFVASIEHRENLVWAMLTGRKRRD